MGGHRGGGLLSVALGVGVVLGSVAGVGVAGGFGAGASTPAPRIALPQAVPHIPADVTQLGAAPSGQVLKLNVALAGQDSAALAQAVDAVSTPGSPDYRHYVTPAQFAAAYGPSSAEVAQVTSVLRNEGLDVGDLEPDSNLLPVSGTASAVSAAFGTSLESVQASNQARTVVNTSALGVPASLSGVVSGVVGLNGLFDEHSMLKRSPIPAGSGTAVSPGSSTSSTPSTPSTSSSAANAPASAGPSGSSGPTANAQQPHQSESAHVQTPQACPAAQATSRSGIYTSTQMSSVFGLSQLFAQGRTGIGQTIALVEFEQYLGSDVQAFQSCYGLSNSIRNEVVDGPVGGSPSGSGEAALDVELAAYNAPASSLIVYEAPNNSDVAAIDVFQKIASDDAARVVTTSWGNCESFVGADVGEENEIFSQMAMQGQTVIAASGDAGSEDCYPDNGSTGLAIDDPGAQPDVVSAGGTDLSSATASAQTVWNDCQGPPALPAPLCADSIFSGSSRGAGGGGFSEDWPRNPGQPIVTSPNPCGQPTGCRSVPDIVYPSDPSSGGVVAYFSGSWTAFGGTSVAAPTNAGLFADTDQGCFASLGRVGPALYAAAGTSNYTPITSGENDFTDTNGGDFPAGTGASGLGSPVDQNLAIALQGADGCPSVSAVSPNTGPSSGGPAITVSGGGLGNATSVTFGSAGNGQIVSETETSLTVIPPNAAGPMCVNVVVQNSQGISPTSSADEFGFGGDLDCGQGYRFVASDGGVFDFGAAGFFGSRGGQALNAPIVGMAVTPSTNGYWLVASDGGIFNYGDAGFHGSSGSIHLNKPIVGIASTPDGQGYWLVASDGGIFNYGDAGFYGSTGSMHLNKPIVGMASTPDGQGYWLVASDGGIFNYGDAGFDGSTGSMHLNSPVVGMAAGPGGAGYWLVAADGGIFNYGSAGFFGSAGSLKLNQPVVGLAASPDFGGYWMVASDGGIFNYGDAQFYGSTGSIKLNKPIVGMASA
jgi:hypothetical protein